MGDVITLGPKEILGSCWGNCMMLCVFNHLPGPGRPRSDGSRSTLSADRLIWGGSGFRVRVQDVGLGAKDSEYLKPTGARASHKYESLPK